MIRVKTLDKVCNFLLISLSPQKGHQNIYLDLMLLRLLSEVLSYYKLKLSAFVHPVLSTIKAALRKH